jgi:hypothetical protein
MGFSLQCSQWEAKASVPKEMYQTLLTMKNYLSSHPCLAFTGRNMFYFKGKPEEPPLIRFKNQSNNDSHTSIHIVNKSHINLVTQFP